MHCYQGQGLAYLSKYSSLCSCPEHDRIPAISRPYSSCQVKMKQTMPSSLSYNRRQRRRSYISIICLFQLSVRKRDLDRVQKSLDEAQDDADDSEYQDSPKR
jgi:hypothetical protein